MNIQLKPPQTEIVRLISLGCTSKEVGTILNLAKSNVEFHKAAAMQALGTTKDTQLEDIAVKHHIIKQNDRLTTREKRLVG